VSAFKKISENAGKIRERLGQIHESTMKWLRANITWPIVSFWFISLIPFFLEKGHALLGKFWSECNPHQAEYGSVYMGVRGFLRGLDPFLHEPDNVRLVTFSVSNEGRFLMANVCETRAFAARLLRKIASVQPSAIVVDWYNLPESCEPDDPRTKDWVDAVTSVVSGRVPNPEGGSFRKVPVITARSTLHPDDLRRDEYLARPDLLDQTGAEFGAIRLDDCEEDRIPFKWYVHPRPDAPAKSLETLSLMAVRRSNHPSIISELRPFIEHENRPYVSLFNEQDFMPLPAIDLICDKRPVHPSGYKVCAADEGDREKLESLGSKIVVLADVSTREDFHRTAVGELPGAVLHANYIEAMVTKRYMRPVNPWLQLVLSIIWFGTVEWVFVRYTHRPWAALFWSLIVVAVFILLFFLVFVRVFGLSFVLLPPSLLLLFIRTCYALGERRGAVIHVQGNTSIATT